ADDGFNDDGDDPNFSFITSFTFSSCDSSGCFDLRAFVISSAHDDLFLIFRVKYKYLNRGLVHESLGGGNVSDVMLWRKKNMSVGIVTVTIGSWMVFETFSYTILTLQVFFSSCSLVSSSGPNLHLSSTVFHSFMIQYCLVPGHHRHHFRSFI
ncbi:unnamed protein product, partial [Brassica rapa subsp. trilocularis]